MYVHRPDGPTCAPPAVLARLAEEVELVLTGTAD